MSDVPLPGEFPALMIGATASIFCCVPETDHLDEVAVALAVVFVLEVAVRRPFGRAVGALEAALVLAAGLYGATGRDSATVGAWFSFWPVVLAVFAFGLARLIGHRAGRHRELGAPRRITIEIIGLVAAIWVARTGALQPTVGPAFKAVAVAAPVSIVLAAAVVAVGVARRPSAS